VSIFLACCVVVTYLIYEPNRWVAIAMTGFALGLVVRDLVQGGAEARRSSRSEQGSSVSH
jgi:hypothetical protein